MSFEQLTVEFLLFYLRSAVHLRIFVLLLKYVSYCVAVIIGIYEFDFIIACNKNKCDLAQSA